MVTAGPEVNTLDELGDSLCHVGNVTRTLRPRGGHPIYPRIAVLASRDRQRARVAISHATAADARAVFERYSGESARAGQHVRDVVRSEEHTSELQSPCNLVCRLLLEKKKKRQGQRSYTPDQHSRIQPAV